MAKKGKLLVRNESEDSVVPFLRGILTRSLQDAGLSFEDAFAVADTVRSRLGDAEVSTQALRRVVAKELTRSGWEAIVEAYDRPRGERSVVFVRDSTGSSVPFSKSILGQSIEVCALPREELFRVAAEVESVFLAAGERVVSSTEVTRETWRVLEEQHGAEFGARYLRWQEFTNTGRPLIFLIGGTPGSGKSTVSALLAHRLGIVRTQSTDMLREVLRQIIPAKLLPPLHRSSFTAHKALPRWSSEESDESVAPRMIDGYLLQAEEVAVGIEGVFHRAVSEQVSLILEGVHMHPGIQNAFKQHGGAVVIPLVLATLGRKALRRQLTGRGRRVSARRAERYLEHFELIWHLQSFLLSEADSHDVGIVQNDDLDECVREIMEIVAERLKREYSGTPEAVFSENPHPRDRSSKDQP